MDACFPNAEGKRYFFAQVFNLRRPCLCFDALTKGEHIASLTDVFRVMQLSKLVAPSPKADRAAGGVQEIAEGDPKCHCLGSIEATVSAVLMP